MESVPRAWGFLLTALSYLLPPSCLFRTHSYPLVHLASPGLLLLSTLQPLATFLWSGSNMVHSVGWLGQGKPLSHSHMGASHSLA